MARKRLTTPALAGILLAAAMAAITARADTVVTVCGDDDAGGGQNLRDALLAGGRIVIRCGSGPASIKVMQTRKISTPTVIVGEGDVTLIGPLARMFDLDANLALHSITVRNPGGAIAVGAAELELDHVQTRDTPAPYTASRFVARDSQFEANGVAAAQSPGVLIDAEWVELHRASFNANFAHPLGGGRAAASGRAALSRQVLIEDSTFSGNLFPVMVHDGVVTVRRTRFQSNGVPPGKAGDSWGCCAGALMLVQSRASIEDSEFTANASSGLGGAISAIGSDVRISRTLFAQNTARSGGAVASLAHLPKSNAWSGGSPGLRPQLRLERTRFRDNLSTLDGGAILWSGEIQGDANLFVGNHARSGGALAHTSVLAGSPSDFGDILAGIDALAPGANESLALARGAFFENEASMDGSAIEAGRASIEMGNALVARNRTKTPGGATVKSENLALANSTVVQNEGIGILLSGSAGKLVLANSIIALNTDAACNAPASQVTATSRSLQFPGSSCGSSISTLQPELDDNYAPLDSSPARQSGDVGTCVGHPLVQGVDLNGKARGNSGVCALGAIEPPPTPLQQILGTVAPDNHSGGGIWSRLFWILLLIFLLIGLVIGYRHITRCRARRAKAR